MASELRQEIGGRAQQEERGSWEIVSYKRETQELKEGGLRRQREVSWLVDKLREAGQ